MFYHRQRQNTWEIWARKCQRRNAVEQKRLKKHGRTRKDAPMSVGVVEAASSSLVTQTKKRAMKIVCFFFILQGFSDISVLRMRHGFFVFWERMAEAGTSFSTSDFLVLPSFRMAPWRLLSCIWTAGVPTRYKFWAENRRKEAKNMTCITENPNGTFKIRVYCKNQNSGRFVNKSMTYTPSDPNLPLRKTGKGCRSRRREIRAESQGSIGKRDGKHHPPQVQRKVSQNQTTGALS